jgi:hypothetical protein
MSSRAKKVKIKIVNPISGCGFTSLEHARRYVRRGQAEWVDGMIRFIRPGDDMRFANPVLSLTERCQLQDEAKQDARPGMPVLPPSIEWLRRAGYRSRVSFTPSVATA